ncbi:gliding motility-associated C-terminal domain-containing protein [Spirosoma aerophilum]
MGNWHNVTEDHTPDDVQGNMLLVNAAADAGEFYSQSITELCNGTTYEFSVWVLNLMNNSESNGCNRVTKVPLDPDIVMRVERQNGEVLQTIRTGTIGRTTNPTWVRYSTQFTTPENSGGIVIKLINNGPGGCGNDLALDDIEIRACQQSLQVNFQDTTATSRVLCENSGTTKMSVTASVTSYVNPVYQWQESSDSSSWNNIQNATQAMYEAPINFSGVRYYRVLCSSAFSGSQPDTACSTISNPLTITTTQDCQSPQLFVPDAFTPNNDGMNDQMQFFYNESFIANMSEFAIQIYNRWGSVVFSSTSLAEGWDGTYKGELCSEGTYSWIINCRLDKKNKRQDFKKIGHIVLKR